MDTVRYNKKGAAYDAAGPDSQSKRSVVQIDKDLQDLIPDYLQGRRKDLQSLRKAVASKDFETIRILGHSMKGSGGGYGFDAITEMGRQLEAAANNKDLEEAGKRLGELTQYLDRIEVSYA